MRAHHIPMHMLERQVEIVEGVQALLKHLNERAGVLHCEAGDGVAGVASEAIAISPDLVWFAPSWYP